MVILDQLLPAWLPVNIEPLIFLKTGTMDILRIIWISINFFCWTDGPHPQVDRESEIAEFRENTKIPVFLFQQELPVSVSI